MPFRIPSLDEARRRQEKQSAEALNPIASLDTKRPATASSSSAASSSAAASGTRKAAVPSTGSVANPYARRNPYLKRPRDDGGGSGHAGPAPAAFSSSAAAASRPANPYGRRGGTAGQFGKGRFSGAGGAATTPKPPPHPPRPPSPPDDPLLDTVDAGATFSQAFGSVEDSSPYRREAAAAAAAVGSVKAGGDDEEGRKLRADQRAFDASLAAEDSSGGAAGPRQRAGGGPSGAKDDRTILQPHVLHVSNRQRGNPLLRLIRNVPWAHADILPDYILGPNRCALFLSIKYHNLHPNYVHRRIAELGKDFDLRVLLVKVDVEDNAATILYLNKLAVVNDLTLILAWSDEESARYLETYKAFEGKDASSIQKREQTTYADRVSDVLCTVRSVNKTDAAQLVGQFGSLRALVLASADEISLCPGIGEKKVRRLWESFHRPFSTAAVRKKRKLEREAEERKKVAEDEKDEEQNGTVQEEQSTGGGIEGKEGASETGPKSESTEEAHPGTCDEQAKG